MCSNLSLDGRAGRPHVLNRFKRRRPMRRQLQIRLGLLGLVSGMLISIPFVWLLAALPLITGLAGVVMGLFAHVGEVSLPRYAAIGTPIAALVCGAIYGMALGTVMEAPSVGLYLGFVIA